jgi:hypothetical protein
MRRLILMFSLLALSSLACNLSESPPTVVPTPAAAAPALQIPVLGLQPVTGTPGTIINVGVAGFPAGSRVNLYLTTDGNTAVANPVARDLTIATGGILTFSVQLPAQVGGTTINRAMPLTMSIETSDRTVRASAIFVATAGTGTATVAASTGGGTTGGTGSTDTLGGQLYITAPAINSDQVGNAITVTGSGSAYNNRVGVQVLDANYNILGSALGTIQATAGGVGPWQVTVAFSQPNAVSVGYVVAYTVDQAGNVADQASIPVTLAGLGVPTAMPTIRPTVPPTVGPVFITATPH